MEKTKKSFNDLLEDLSRSKDTSKITKSQKNTLRRYEETNEMLRQFLELSDATHKMLLESFTQHSKTLITLKKDLESSFKRIRTLKTTLKQKYPDAFEATSHAIRELEERYQLEDEKIYERETINNEVRETSGSQNNKNENDTDQNDDSNIENNVENEDNVDFNPDNETTLDQNKTSVSQSTSDDHANPNDDTLDRKKISVSQSTSNDNANSDDDTLDRNKTLDDHKSDVTLDRDETLVTELICDDRQNLNGNIDKELNETPHEDENGTQQDCSLVEHDETTKNEGEKSES